MLTNKYGLPHQFENLLQRDNYDSGNSRMTITRLLSSPRIALLEREHAKKIVTDISDEVWKLLGKCIHTVMEEGADESDIIEKRMYAEINGWKISGQCDAIRTEGDKKILMDWKFTSAYAIGKNQSSWEQQLNCYAYLARHDLEINVDELQVIAILRDWQKSKAVNSNSYPQAQVHVVEIPMWSEQEQHDFLLRRVAAHQDALFEYDIDGTLPLCTDEDRWKRNSIWAVQKIGGIRSIKNFDTAEEAHVFHAKMKSKEGYQITERQGEPIRCAGGYCKIAQWCEQFQSEGTQR